MLLAWTSRVHWLLPQGLSFSERSTIALHATPPSRYPCSDCFPPLPLFFFLISTLYNTSIFSPCLRIEPTLISVDSTVYEGQEAVTSVNSSNSKSRQVPQEDQLPARVP